MMKAGEKSKVLGTIGDFEIGARWQWKVQLHTVTICLLGVTIALLLLLTVGLAYFWIEFSKLAKTQAELAHLKAELLDIQMYMQSELITIRMLRDDIELSNWANKDEPVGERAKRNIEFKGNNSVNKITAVHLQTDVPYIKTETSGIISRWHPQYSPFSGSYDLIEHNSRLRVNSTGLYLIYAQLCYAATREDNNTFEVRVMNQGLDSQQSKIIAQCSAGTSSANDEITCFTSIAQVLRAGDTIFLQQLQKNRPIFMSMGRSFMGVVKLAELS